MNDTQTTEICQWIGGDAKSGTTLVALIARISLSIIASSADRAVPLQQTPAPSESPNSRLSVFALDEVYPNIKPIPSERFLIHHSSSSHPVLSSSICLRGPLSPSVFSPR